MDDCAMTKTALDKFSTRLITLLTDWLLVLLGVSSILWLIIRLPVFTPPSAHTSLVPAVTQKNLKKHVKSLVDYYSPRTLAFGNLNITAQYIHDELGKYGTVQYQAYQTLAGRFRNVVLSLGPDTKDVLVIGAHYDAENDSLDSEGNASGVATLIELARLLSSNKDQLPLQVLIVAYPLSQKKTVPVENMGSYNHASLLRAQNKNVRLMISLDGVGRFNTAKNSQHYPYQFMKLFYPDSGDYISLIGRMQDISKVWHLKESFGRATSLPIYSFNAPQNYTLTSSYDHINYQTFGFPAVLLSDTAQLREQASTKEDVVDQLDYKKMSMLVQGLYQTVMDAKPAETPVRIVRQKPSDEDDKANLLQ